MTTAPWVMVGWASEVGPVPRATKVDGIDFVTYTDRETSTPRVAPMHCPHRGASLVRGKVEGRCVVCPYHGREVEPLGIDRVDVRDGIVWMKTAADDEDVVAPPPQLPEWSDPAFSTFEYTRRIETAIDAMIENTLDWHHVDHVHSVSLAKKVVPAMTFASDGHGHGRVRYEYSLAAEREHSAPAAERELVVENEFWTPYTSTIRFTVGGSNVLVLWMSATPGVGPREVSLHIRVSRNYARWVPDFLVRAMNDFVLDEDREVVRNVPANFPGTLEDTGTDTFIRMYRDAMRS